MTLRSIKPSAGLPSDEVLCVDPKQVEKIWPHAKAFIVSAFEGRDTDATFEGTEADVLCGLSLLWIAWIDDKVRAAVTTSLIMTPRHKVCVLTAGGGNDLGRWLRFLTKIEAYARDEGCDRVRVVGRKGWSKMLPGYHEPWVTLDKRLRD